MADKWMEERQQKWRAREDDGGPDRPLEPEGRSFSDSDLDPGPPTPSDYYHAGYLDGPRERRRGMDGRGILERTADQLASWFGSKVARH